MNCRNWIYDIFSKCNKCEGQNNLSNDDLTAINLSYSTINGTDFSKSILLDANFDYAKFGSTKFENSDMTNALITHDVLQNVDLKGANLKGAD